MPPLLSIYLDFVRFSAALVVFWGHVSGQRMTGGLLWQFSLFMDQAVMVFFVLSGYVVAYATDRPRITGRDYVVARASRILSVAVPALVVTLVLDTAGTSLRPDLYQPWWGYVGEGKPWQYLSAILFLGQVWWHPTSVGSNLPYWSLHYEVWYYVIFGLAMFMPAKLRMAALLAAGLIVGPPDGRSRSARYLSGSPTCRSRRTCGMRSRTPGCAGPTCCGTTSSACSSRPISWASSR